MMPFVLALVIRDDGEYWLSTRQGAEFYALVYFFYGVVWIFSIFLLMYERRKRLPEAWYCHKLFWALNFVINLTMTFLEF